MDIDALILEHLSYDSISGKITNLKTRSSNCIAGSLALNTYSEGYYCGTFFNKILKSHRVAWFLYYGSWPSGHIDHINGNKRDNRIENLREVNDSQNSFNRNIHTNNTSGIKGVSFNRRRGKWRAYITSNGKRIFSDGFDTIEQAEQFRIDAEKRLHGEYSHRARSEAIQARRATP